MSKQTAVEWILEKITLKIYLYPIISLEDIEQAKEMEKEQIMNSWAKGVISDNNMTAEQHYNETFKNK